MLYMFKIVEDANVVNIVVVVKLESGRSSKSSGMNWFAVPLRDRYPNPTRATATGSGTRFLGVGSPNMQCP